MTPRTVQGPVANPIADWLAGGTAGRSTVNLVKAFKEQSAIGYTTVKADVPTDIAVEDYLPGLESFGPAAALSLYSEAFAAHPHAGERVETEHERRTVLDDAAPELLAFGRDRWYMSWAGRDVVEVLRDDSDRIVGAHLNDTSRMNQGDVPSPSLRECQQTAHDWGTTIPQLGN